MAFWHRLLQWGPDSRAGMEMKSCSRLWFVSPDGERTSAGAWSTAGPSTGCKLGSYCKTLSVLVQVQWDEHNHVPLCDFICLELRCVYLVCCMYILFCIVPFM
jgi:hypothetical protein